MEWQLESSAASDFVCGSVFASLSLSVFVIQSVTKPHVTVTVSIS